jgi:heterodisulfide reductase subunit A
VEIAADMVVVSPAMIPSPGTRQLAEMLGLEVDTHGWWVEQESNLAPLETNRPGILLAGTGTGPKDIPEAVAQGSGAAGKVLSLLARWAAAEPLSAYSEGAPAAEAAEGATSPPDLSI